MATDTQDSDGLEALFDSIAAATRENSEPVAEVDLGKSITQALSGSSAEEESEEALEALFDSIAAEKKTVQVEKAEVVIAKPSPVKDESEEALEALFDDIVATNKQIEAADQEDNNKSNSNSIVAADVEEESEEALEALFDSISGINAQAAKPAVTPKAAGSAASNATETQIDSAKVMNQIGQMARTLHDALRELGLHNEIQKVASFIPNARDRLGYVAQLTNQAAERVLNATEAAQPVVEKMESNAQALARQWDLLFDKQLDAMQFKQLVTQTHQFLNDVPSQTRATNAYLLEIMMAQDFQDLTGQVIKKITELTNDMERQLLALLVENAPSAVRAEINSGLLNGPVINPEGRSDVVTSQDQVDDLLESLGF